jgi:hypothetical protein
MIKIEVVNVWGFKHAIRGMRNPMNSWDKSDSVRCDPKGCCYCKVNKENCENAVFVNPDQNFGMGSADLDLMHRLYVAGSEHRKFMRMIHVSMDVTAPLYWWKEFDTYKVGTVTNSCSTMHKIHKKAFELDDFSWNQLLNTDCDLIEYTWQNGLFKKMVQPLQLLTDFIIPSLNVCREKYLETKDKKYWWQMIQLLPSSYNQKRTLDFNYETAVQIIRQRTGHKLDEWHTFVDTLWDLPYMREIVGDQDEQK